MSHLDVATRALIQRLLQVAAGRTGQAGTAAAALLAGWNAKSRGDFALTNLWLFDNAADRETLATGAFIATLRECPAACERSPPFGQLVAVGRPALARTGDV